MYQLSVAVSLVGKMLILLADVVTPCLLSEHQRSRTRCGDRFLDRLPQIGAWFFIVLEENDF